MYFLYLVLFYDQKSENVVHDADTVFNFNRCRCLSVELNEVIECVFHLLDFISRSLFTPVVNVGNSTFSTSAVLPSSSSFALTTTVNSYLFMLLPPFGLWPLPSVYRSKEFVICLMHSLHNQAFSTYHGLK